MPRWFVVDKPSESPHLDTRVPSSPIAHPMILQDPVRRHMLSSFFSKDQVVGF